MKSQPSPHYISPQQLLAQGRELLADCERVLSQGEVQLAHTRARIAALSGQNEKESHERTL